MPVVLIIDETDSAASNQVFIDFLAQLRTYYLNRDKKNTKTFQSFILAGVYDIKNLKLKIQPDNQYIPNSPWNIAADFDIDMSLSQNGNAVISNRIFETLLYNLYLSLPEMHETTIYTASLNDKNQFVHNSRLNMHLVLEKFITHFNDIYASQQENFIEEEGRKYFLLYLMPIINGTGNYYIEARTRNMVRTDIIVDYNSEQYIIEMKIWHVTEYNNQGKKQLANYLDDYHASTGYMISFNFNKNKQTGIKETRINGKLLIEAVV